MRSGATIAYQLDLVTPGKRPNEADSRKQMRHNPNFRMYPRLRPQFLQRFTWRVENFGVRCDLTIRLFLAMYPPSAA
jgi:hypothetical protein